MGRVRGRVRGRGRGRARVRVGVGVRVRVSTTTISWPSCTDVLSVPHVLSKLTCTARQRGCCRHCWYAARHVGSPQRTW